MVEFWCFVGGAFCGSVGLLLYATILALIDHRQRIRRQSRDMLRWLDERVKQEGLEDKP